MRIRWIAAALALTAVNAAQAAPRICFQPAEIEADQAIQYQTELMVLADACKDGAYVGFTQRNREAIVAYQHAMIEHFRRGSGKKAEAAFETYLTHLANEEALRTAQQSVPAFCAGGVKRLEDAKAIAPEGFRQLVSERATTSHGQYKLCGAESKGAKTGKGGKGKGKHH